MSLSLLDAARALTADSTDQLASVLSRVMTTTETRGLQVVPAHLDTDSVVTLDSHQLTVEDVISIAAKCETQLLYVRTVQLNARAISNMVAELDLSLEEDSARNTFIEALHKANGWISTLELGFAHAGVLHVWSLLAPWTEHLELIESTGRTGTSPWNGSVRLDSDVDRLDDDAIRDIAQELAALPAFRRAQRRSEYEAAAQQISSFAALSADAARWDRHRVVNIAMDLVRPDSASSRLS